MNVDENGQTPQTYGIMGIPTLILFKGGQPVEKVVGFESKAKLLERIAKHI
jgi:thioredoxin 1